MRKLIYAINLSIDGCFDLTIGPPPPDDELFKFSLNLLRDAGIVVFGRVTYEIMVPFWPNIAKNPANETKADVEFAEAFEAVEKIVFSKSLEKAESKNTRIFPTKAENEIRKLKQEEGKNIYVGGVALSSHLIQLGLVDEFIFTVFPRIVGKGRRLMEGLHLVDRLQLRLVESKVFPSGCVALRYVKN
jgi:dihydrofolate reductase